MRESRTYGSVRGALSNGRPYRDTATMGGFISDSGCRCAHPDYACCTTLFAHCELMSHRAAKWRLPNSEFSNNTCDLPDESMCQRD